MTDYISFQTWICPKCFDDHSIFSDCTPVEIGVFMPSETDKSFIAEKYREQNAKIKELEAKLELAFNVLKAITEDRCFDWDLMHTYDSKSKLQMFRGDCLEALEKLRGE